MIAGLGLPRVPAPKRLDAGRPNAVGIIENGTFQAAADAVTGALDTLQDGFRIRRAAAAARIPRFTSLDAARAAVASVSGAERGAKPLTERRDGAWGACESATQARIASGAPPVPTQWRKGIVVGPRLNRAGIEPLAPLRQSPSPTAETAARDMAQPPDIM